ncbi:MAG: hypothetical protein QM478_06015 [Flavobacteriaceae bacterium]
MKKYINLKNLIFFGILLFSLASCDENEDIEPIASTADYPVATFQVLDTDINDRQDGIIRVKVTFDKALTRGVTFSAEQTGGTATEGEDFDITAANILAYSTETIVEIQIYGDIEVEGDETIVIKMNATALNNQYLINPTTVFPEFTINITDYVFCLWTLDSRDTYGDGWNGGYVLLDSEGIQTQYATDGPQTVFDIPVTVGADYTFTYVSGGGTGGGPGWESENYYLLTAPDGTEFEGGTQDYSGIPTPGEITSGTSTCN